MPGLLEPGRNQEGDVPDRQCARVKLRKRDMSGKTFDMKPGLISCGLRLRISTCWTCRTRLPYCRLARADLAERTYLYTIPEMNNVSSLKNTPLPRHPGFPGQEAIAWASRSGEMKRGKWAPETPSTRRPLQTRFVPLDNRHCL